jgi:pilus assembly protein Flp/PilA
MLRAFCKDESGATAIEYAIIAGFLSIVVVASVASIGGTLDGGFQDVDAGLQ